MKYDLYNQFLPIDRAILLLEKYPFLYVQNIVNGFIEQALKNNEIPQLNYWNEVSLEIKTIKKL